MTRSNQHKESILILGCGLGGMITALSLAKHNIPSLIIEAKSATDQGFFDNDIRTTALNAHTKQYFEQIAVWRMLEPYCGRINDIYVADNKAPEMIHFASEYTVNNEVMGYLIENSIFKKCLYDLSSNNENITIWENKQYCNIANEEGSCSVTFNDGNVVKCNLLIVCDGRNSYAKNLFFSNDINNDYNQTAITFIVHHEQKHEGTAVEHFMKSGPFAILPLKDENKSSVVWTLPKDHAEVITKLSIEELTYLVQENFGEFLGEVKIVSKIAAFPLTSQTARRYYNKNVVLVADTAHIIHPLAGQGLNQGIKDIEVLAGLVANHGISANTLMNYEKCRQDDNEDMLLITDTINSIFSSKSKILHGARQAGFKAIENVSPFKKLLIKYAMGKR